MYAKTGGGIENAFGEEVGFENLGLIAKQYAYLAAFQGLGAAVGEADQKPRAVVYAERRRFKLPARLPYGNLLSQPDKILPVFREQSRPADGEGAGVEKRQHFPVYGGDEARAEFPAGHYRARSTSVSSCGNPPFSGLHYVDAQRPLYAPVSASLVIR